MMFQVTNSCILHTRYLWGHAECQHFCGTVHQLSLAATKINVLVFAVFNFFILFLFFRFLKVDFRQVYVVGNRIRPVCNFFSLFCITV